MSETVEKDARLIEKHLPDGVDRGDVDSSLFTDREAAAYLLAERSNLTWEEAAGEMGISYGTFSGKVGGNVDDKKERARATLKLIEAIEGE